MRPASYKHRIANSGIAPIVLIHESFTRYARFSLAGRTSIVPVLTLTTNAYAYAYAEPWVRFSDDKHRVSVEAKGITFMTAIFTVILSSGDHSSWADAYLEK